MSVSFWCFEEENFTCLNHGYSIMIQRLNISRSLNPPSLGYLGLGISGLYHPKAWAPLGFGTPRLEVPQTKVKQMPRNSTPLGWGALSCLSSNDFRRLLMTARLVTHSTTLALERDLAS